MKTIETASNGTTVKTYSVHIQEADCFLLVQEILSLQGELQVRNTITLSRADIKALAETEAYNKITNTTEGE